MTTKFTPGPWTVDYSGPARLAINDTAERIIAFGNLQNEDGDEDEANARLIASAPELLEALQTLAAEEYRDDDDEVLISARDKARAAIAKATQA